MRPRSSEIALADCWFIRTSEAAAQLGLSDEAIYTLIHCGLLRAIRLPSTRSGSGRPPHDYGYRVAVASLEAYRSLA